MNIGDILIWGLRLFLIGVCLYGLLTRIKPIFLIGLSGLGGSIFGWGLATMLLKDPVSGLLGTLFGLAVMFVANRSFLLRMWNRRKGYWIQINDQKIWVPRGTREIDVFIELIRNPSNPTSKIEKSILPKKGEKEEEYKKRMR